MLRSNSTVVDTEGRVLVRLLKKAVPENLLHQLEEVANEHKEQAQRKFGVIDIRGGHTTVKFGSYVERGGSGSIWTINKYPAFFTGTEGVRKYVSQIFKNICPEVASCASVVPADIQVCDGITLMFWNATSVNKVHLDPRDWEWSMVVCFGNFSQVMWISHILTQLWKHEEGISI